MYKKVLYNIKNFKKMWGEGEGQYLNPLSMYLKKKKKKKRKNFFLTEPGLEPTTSGLEIH